MSSIWSPLLEVPLYLDTEECQEGNPAYCSLGTHPMLLFGVFLALLRMLLVLFLVSLLALSLSPLPLPLRGPALTVTVFLALLQSPQHASGHVPGGYASGHVPDMYKDMDMYQDTSAWYCR